MLAVLVLGLIAGYLARLLTPGRTVSGCLPTIAVGVVGSFVGFFLFTEVLGIGRVGSGDGARLVNPGGGLVGAVLGTVLVLVLLNAISRR